MRSLREWDMQLLPIWHNHKLYPHTHNHLCKEVKRDPSQEDVGEIFKDSKGSVDYPVSQPLCVVILLFGIYSLAAVEGKRERAVQTVCTQSPKLTRDVYSTSSTNKSHTKCTQKHALLDDKNYNFYSKTNSLSNKEHVHVSMYTLIETHPLMYGLYLRLVGWVHKS